MPTGIDKDGKKGLARRRVVAIHKAHPDWNVYEITDEMRKDPATAHYTATAVRTALRVNGLKAAKPKTREGWRASHYDGVAPKEPKRVKAQPKQQHRAAVHSYHGRSRLSASYTEL